jgi:hypothetical protein
MTYYWDDDAEHEVKTLKRKADKEDNDFTDNETIHDPG